jgi:hypothetical protein
VDSTFAPPPLQYPFKWGADIVMHSGKGIVAASALVILIHGQVPNTLAATPIFCVVYWLFVPRKSGRQ